MIRIEHAVVPLFVAVIGLVVGQAGGSSIGTEATWPDTVRVEVGSPLVNGTVYPAHDGVVTRLRIDGDRVDTTGRWTNILVIGDSAGRAVHRWHTSGTTRGPGGRDVPYDLWQTFDARTLALYGYHLRSGNGTHIQLAIDGVRVRGTRRTPADSAPRSVDITLPRAGFVSGASDLIPQAVEGGLREELVITAPIWSPQAGTVELQMWSVRRRTTVEFDGRQAPAWEVEHYSADRALLGTIWLVDDPPYMVRWDIAAREGGGPFTRMVGERRGG
jgi:hypothetical protein